MTIFLTVLKVIGWIALILLLLVIALLLLVLFVPLRYRIKGGNGTGLWADARITWLLHLVGVEVHWDGKKLSMSLRILCFRKELGRISSEETELQNLQAAAEKEERNGRDLREDGEAEKEHIGRALDEWLSPGEKKTDRKKEAGLLRKVQEKIRTFGEKIKSIFQSILGMLKNIRETAAKVYGMISDKGNQAAVRFLLGEIFYFLKKLKPRKLKVNAEFSAGGPDTTGQALGVLSMFPAVYGKDWQVTPDFEAEEAYLKGEADARGRLFPFQVLGMAIRIVADKNCRRFFKLFI